jgi:hypothetical protein
MRGAPPVHFVVPVWGESYVRTFLDYCLPAQLSPDNIPSLGKDGGDQYIIYTTPADQAVIEASESCRALQRFMPVTFEHIDLTLFDGEKYQCKSECYRKALQQAIASNAAVIALNADVLFANGFLRSVKNLLTQGKRVIEVPGPRGLRDPIAKALDAEFRGADGISISIEPIELAKLWLKNLHPQLQMHYVEGVEGETFHPSHLYWLVGQEGAIIRGFHLYPIVIYPGNRSVNFSGTIDDDLVANLGVTEQEKYLAQDSRELFCCELSLPETNVGRMAGRGDMRRVVEFYLSYSRNNIDNIKKEILITGVPVLGDIWKVRRKQSAQFTRRVLRLYNAERRRRTLQTLIARARAAIIARVRAAIFRKRAS